MNVKRDPEPVPDLTLEQYLLGELAPPAMARLRARLDREDPLRRRLEDLRQSDEALARVFPAARMAEQVRTRLRERQEIATRSVLDHERTVRSWRRPVWAATAAAIVLLLVTVLPRSIGPGRGGVPRGPDGSVPQGPNGAFPRGDQIKGLEPALKLFRKTMTGSELLADSSLACSGDLIRIAYRAAGHPWGAILSMDTRGALTVHLPVGGTTAAALRNEEAVLLDSAYELDDAPGWERFYLIVSDARFALEPLIADTRRAAVPAAPPDSLILSTGLQQFVFSLRKGTEP